VAPPIRSNIWFPAPRPFHPGACKRRQRITDQISTRPSSTAAAASPQLSAAFSAQRSSENHPPPKPLPRQIPIEAKRSPLPRAFVLRRLSDAGPLILGRSLAPGRHPKPFTKPAVRDTGPDRLNRVDAGRSRFARPVNAYVLLAVLGQRRDGRPLIGRNRSLEIGLETRATRARGPRLLRAASVCPLRLPVPRGRA